MNVTVGRMLSHPKAHPLLAPMWLSHPRAQPLLAPKCAFVPSAIYTHRPSFPKVLSQWQLQVQNCK